jgi:drug/metabolite transporter (DMT)-like permease
MKDQKAAYIYALLAVFFWSTVATAFKLTLKETDQFTMLLIASASSALVLFISLSVQKKLPLLKSLSLKDYAYSAFLGALNPFLYYLVLFTAYDLLRAQEAQTLNYFWAIILVLLSIPILKQKISAKSFGAILLSFFGVYIIASQGNVLAFEFTDTYGVSLALGSAFIWALYWIYNSKDRLDDSLRLCLNFVFGTIYITVLIYFISDFKTISFRALAGGSYIGIFEMGLTFLFWSKALKLSETTAKISNLVFLSPFLSLIFINTLLGEKILISTIVGLVFIIGGILLQRWLNKKSS